MGGALSAFVEFGDHRHFGVAHRDGAGGGGAGAVLVPAGEGRVRVRRGGEGDDTAGGEEGRTGRAAVGRAKAQRCPTGSAD